MKDAPGILNDIRTVREIESSLEEAEGFIDRVKSNKVRLTLNEGNISISREEMAKITDLVITLERSGKALETAVKYLRELMAYDEVTRMYSRRYIFNLLEKELYRSSRYENQFSVIAMEIMPLDKDGNEAYVNAEDYNFLMGEAARVVRKFIRDSDSPGRTSEKTCMALLPETPAKGALILAERIRKAVDKDFELPSGQTVHLTMHGGIIDSVDPAVTDMAGLLYVVDQKLSEAREKGANCMVK